MRLFLFIILMFLSPLYSQNILDVYPIIEFDPISVSVKDSDIVVLKPIPFQVSYLIEFKKDTYISKVCIDRSIESIQLAAFIENNWIYFQIHEQAFVINKPIQYLLVKYKENCDNIYLLICN